MIRKLLALLFLLGVVGLVGLTIWRHERRVQAAEPAGGAEANAPGHRAMFYEKRAGSLVQCRLCPNECRLSDGQLGLCRARKNRGGELYSLVYGQVATTHVDPIEKKPFFHVLPGEQAFSLATPACNLRCLFCQNWELSQAFPWEIPTTPTAPEAVVRAALASGAKAIAFTYTEPVIYYEYALDIAKLARAKGLKVLVVSNGYINPEPLRALLPYVDAYKVDFKAFDEDFYRELTGGTLAPVLATMKLIHQSGVWLEVVNLLVTDKNDSEAMVRGLARWVKQNLGPDVPVHFSRFYPQHKLKNLPPTPVERVIRARQIALAEGLHYVYTGNIAYPEGECTYAPGTGELLIRRQGYFVQENRLREGQGPHGERVPGVWK